MDRFKQLVDDMKAHAARDYPRECCGIVTKDFIYHPAKNVSDKPKDSFIVDPASLIEHDENIWGIFHSHPGDEDPIPSKEDKLGATFDEYKYVVGFNKKFYAYWLDKNLDVLRFDEFKKEMLDGSSKVSQ